MLPALAAPGGNPASAASVLASRQRPTLPAPATAPLPTVVSIGGVKASNAADTIAAGCAGAAVVSGLFAVESPTEAARQLLTVVDGALAARQQQ